MKRNFTLTITGTLHDPEGEVSDSDLIDNMTSIANRAYWDHKFQVDTESTLVDGYDYSIKVDLIPE